MPFDYWDYMGLDQSAPTYTPGRDSTTEYSGDSKEDFYDYLMTPRRKQRWSGSGAIKHFGPSRYASVDPESAAMANILLQQMEAEDQMEFNRGIRASDMARRKAQDELLMPKGRGGGTISMGGMEADVGGGYAGRGTAKFGYPDVTLPVGGGMPEEGPPAGPPERLTEGQELLFGQEGRARASRQYEGMPTKASGGMSNADRARLAKLNREAGELADTFARQLPDKHPFEGETPEGLIKKFVEDPESMPEHMDRALQAYLRKRKEMFDAFPQNIGPAPEPWPGPGQ